MRKKVWFFHLSSAHVSSKSKFLSQKKTVLSSGDSFPLATHAIVRNIVETRGKPSFSLKDMIAAFIFINRLYVSSPFVRSLVFSGHFFLLLFVLFHRSLILILTPLTFFMHFYLILHVSSSPAWTNHELTQRQNKYVHIHKVTLFFTRSDRLIVSVPRGLQSQHRSAI